MGPETRAASAHFSISVRKTDGNGGCATVISKKIAKLSVSRHLLKRRMLSVMKGYCAKDTTLIVYARPGASSLPYQELKTELTELLSRALTQGA